MNVKLAESDSFKVSQNLDAAVGALRLADGCGKRFVVMWPHPDESFARWHGESGLDCGCGCGPDVS